MFIADSTFMDAQRRAGKELRQSRWWKEKIQSAQCYYCQKSLRPVDVTMDHLLPILRGGQSTKDNVVIACRSCNGAKGSQTNY